MGDDQKHFSVEKSFVSIPHGGNFTFIAGGDVAVNPIADKMNVQAVKQNPNFIMIGGDLSYGNLYDFFSFF